MSHIDPGLDENWNQAEQDVEHDEHEEWEKEAKEEEETFLNPGKVAPDAHIRWWLASTGFPLIAGTFGPIANAFSVCALAVKWRVWIPANKDYSQEHQIADPKWLTIVNAISLVLALGANLALLLTMARRLRFSIAQPITIIGWYAASIMLIALVCACSAPSFRIEPRNEHALSQAYYYGIIAAILYFVIASLLVVTVWGAYKGHYKKDFKLNASQRTLMLQTISFTVYLLLGALIYSYVEGWMFLDAVFWANFTLLTIGIGGPLAPLTHTGRALLFPYAIGGIIMVGLVVGSVRSLALERAKVKMSARFLENARENAIASLDRHERTIKLGFFETIKLEKDLSETERREQEFRLMRRIQTKADKKRRYTSLAMSTSAALLLWFLGALVFMYSEKPQGWSYFVSLYFSYTSLTTIGYGDFIPTSFSGRPFFVFWTILAVPTLTIQISHMGDTVIKAFKDITIWIGALTVLPDQGITFRQTLNVGLKKFQVRKIFNKNDHGAGEGYTAEDRVMDCLVSRLAKEELGAAKKEEEEHGDTLDRDIRFYQFVLAKEIRQVMKDVEMSPPKQYTYAEWAYYLRLVGQDESDAARHRAPTDGKEHKKGEASLGAAYGGDKQHRWSWLGVRSPLMSGQDEAEWILERLTFTLEDQMRKMQTADWKHRREKPPISLTDYQRRNNKKDDIGRSPSPKRMLQHGMNPAEVRRRHMNEPGKTDGPGVI